MQLRDSICENLKSVYFWPRNSGHPDCFEFWSPWLFRIRMGWLLLRRTIATVKHPDEEIFSRNSSLKFLSGYLFMVTLNSYKT